MRFGRACRPDLAGDRDGFARARSEPIPAEAAPCACRQRQKVGAATGHSALPPQFLPGRPGRGVVLGSAPPATALTFTTDPPCRAGLLACTSAPDAAQICAGYAWDEVECMDDDRRPVPRSCKIPGATGRPRINLMQNPEKTGEIIVSCTEVRCQPWRRSALVQNCKTAKLANDT
jgi:hypothetical protein